MLILEEVAGHSIFLEHYILEYVWLWNELLLGLIFLHIGSKILARPDMLAPCKITYVFFCNIFNSELLRLLFCHFKFSGTRFNQHNQVNFDYK